MRVGGAILFLGGLWLALSDVAAGFRIAGLAAVLAGGLSLALYPLMRSRPNGSWAMAHTLVAALSLALWVSVVGGGLFIAFV